jgi:hypothetical protein
MTLPNIVFYPFAYGIPWSVEDGVIVPYLSDVLWGNFITSKYTKINLLCPGYLLENLIAAQMVKILKLNNVEIDSWLVPDYYKGVYKAFGINITGTNGNIFEEKIRLNEAKVSYTTPVFFDGNDNVYFNTLFNYKEVVNINNIPQNEDDKPFWMQILDNGCREYGVNPLSINIDKLKIKGKKIMESLGLTNKVVVIDNSNTSLVDDRNINRRYFNQVEARGMSMFLGGEGLNCLLMNSRRDIYFGTNLYTMPSWYDYDSYDLLAVLSVADHVVSCDPTIYLTAAILGCKSIIALDDKIKGWSFDDVKGICLDNGNWRYLKSSSYNNILGELINEDTNNNDGDV